MSATLPTSPKTAYFQWQKPQGYPVYLRVPMELLEGRLQKLVADLGFYEVTLAEQAKIPLHRSNTRVLSLNRASPRVALQVRTSDTLDRFGSEVLHPREAANVYLHRRIGMMVFNTSTTLWELGLASTLETTEELMGLRVMLNRFLSWALAPQGVVGFWGVATTDGFVIMQRAQSFGEAVFVDVERRWTFSSAGAKPLEGAFTILRAEKGASAGKPLSREELVSFLCTHTTYLSHTGLPTNLRKTAYALGSLARGEWGGLPPSPPERLSNA